MMKLNKNMFKGMVAALILSIGATGLAMEDDPNDEIHLVPAQGLQVVAPKEVVQLSRTMADLLKDNPNTPYIPLPNIPDDALLLKIVELMKKLYEMGNGWDKVKEERELWVKAQELYPKVREMIKSTDESINLFIAFNYLDVPILLRVMAIRLVEKLSKESLGTTVPFIDAIAYGPRNERKAQRDTLVSKGSNFTKFGQIDFDLYQVLAQAMEPHSIGFANESKYNLKVEVIYTDGSAPLIKEPIIPGGRTVLTGLDMSKIKEIKVTSLGAVALTNKTWTYTRADLLQRWTQADRQPSQTRMRLVVTTGGIIGTGFIVNLKVVPEVPTEKK
jgi:hypothetical protein